MSTKSYSVLLPKVQTNFILYGTVLFSSFMFSYQTTDVTRNRTRDFNINWANLSNFLIHVFTVLILIQHMYIPSTHVEFHCVPLEMEPVKLPTCSSSTGRFAMLYYKNLPLRLLCCNIPPSRLSRICNTVFRLSRYFCIVRLAV